MWGLVSSCVWRGWTGAFRAQGSADTRTHDSARNTMATLPLSRHLVKSVLGLCARVGDKGRGRWVRRSESPREGKRDVSCVCVCVCVCLCVHPGSFNMQQGNRVRGVTSACLCAPVPSAPRLLFLPPRTHLANRSLACPCLMLMRMPDRLLAGMCAHPCSPAGTCGDELAP
jgi:hypothetical protein